MSSDRCKQCGGYTESYANIYYPFCSSACRGTYDTIHNSEALIAALVKHDPVNHPSHYQDPSGVECITITRHRNFNIGNAIKYLWRAGLKSESKHIEDLEKAIWYIKDEIERLKTGTQTI